jgi:hypothetical protein
MGHGVVFGDLDDATLSGACVVLVGRVKVRRRVERRQKGIQQFGLSGDARFLSIVKQPRLPGGGGDEALSPGEEAADGTGVPMQYFRAVRHAKGVLPLPATDVSRELVGTE